MIAASIIQPLDLSKPEPPSRSIMTVDASLAFTSAFMSFCSTFGGPTPAFGRLLQSHSRVLAPETRRPGYRSLGCP